MGSKRDRQLQRVAAAAQRNEHELHASAYHEAAHAIAAFHFDMTIGERGCFCYFSDYKKWCGFTDVIVTTDERYRGKSLLEIARPDRLAYMAEGMIGPVAEYNYRNEGIEGFVKHHRGWMSNFGCALGIASDNHYQTTGRGGLSEENYEKLVALTAACFFCLMNPDQPFPQEFKVQRGDELVNMGDDLKDAVLLADRLRTNYAPLIQQFADSVIANNRCMNGAECAEWAAKHFALLKC